ncbi:MAG: cytochrome c [Planctomycetes bacterium]|nr:cytochrome c [Planctomycetota bacterium]
MVKFVSVALFLAVLSLCIACQSVPAGGAGDGQPEPALSEEEGRELYERKCGRCHDPVPEGRYTARQWAGFVRAMAVRSNLTSAQREQLTNYLAEHARRSN